MFTVFRMANVDTDRAEAMPKEELWALMREASASGGYALTRLDFPIAPEAASYPFMHSADDRSDLGRLRERHYPDPRNVV